MSTVSDHARHRARLLPTVRRHAAAPARPTPVMPPPPSFVSLSAHGTDIVEVADGAAILGYVEVVRPVFVALAGPRYDIAVEIVQTMSFEHAVAALREARRMEP